MSAVAKIDEMQGYAHLVMISRNSSFEQMPHTKVATDRAQIAFRARHVRTRALTPDYFHSGKLRQITSDLILHADGEIRVFAIWTKIFEGQYRDGAFYRGGVLHVSIQPSAESNRDDNYRHRCRCQRESSSTRPCFGAEFCVAAVDHGK